MIKPKLNVLDLDDTLIPYDSFMKYVFLFWKKPKLIVRFTYYACLRKMRLIGASEFKEKIVKNARRISDYESSMQAFAKKLVTSLNRDVIQQINSYTDNNTKTIICSASPVDYVQYFADALGFDCIASELMNSHFEHVYGKKKIERVIKLYPPDRYDYHFAISDSNSDLKLLKLFKHYKIYKK